MKTENERVTVNLMIDRLPKSVARNSRKTAMYVIRLTFASFVKGEKMTVYLK